MSDFAEKILATLARKSYEPLKPKLLARKVGVPASQYGEFRRALNELIRLGRVQFGKNHTIRPSTPQGTVAGTYRRTSSGLGFVRPQVIEGKAGPDIRISENDALDAATGDEVLVQITRKARSVDQNAVGRVVRILERATRLFVGTYHERDGQGLVRVDGTVFSHSIYVGDPGAKGARPEDKVVMEMVRFPSTEGRGEGVITEVLGPRGKPGVDLLSVIREFGLPDVFPDDVLEEARELTASFDEENLGDREDLTGVLIVTVDPVDARDFDDAISLTIDPKSKHWQLGVHIADVAHFAPPGSALDREARKRATSVYLPQRVLPMFPELLSNGLASLQQDRVRFTKTVFIDFTPQGQRADVRFANSAIRVKKRFAYEQVSALLKMVDEGGKKKEEGKAHVHPPKIDPEVFDLLLRMRDLAMILRKRRIKRGALELTLPETELEYDDQGRVSGAHFVKHDVSHQIIEEFMLAANEAVAGQLAQLEIPFLRRVHPSPEPTKLESFSRFAQSLGYKLGKHVDRFSLQRVLEQTASQPDVYAVHYALLRSLKQAIYSPAEQEHYALASDNYCHFTSPIRRYPDLTVHRLLGQWLRTGRAGSDETELAALGEHCSKMERRSAIAERELVKLKLLNYLNERIGLELDAIITGVADYGFFAQGEELPVEGLVHVDSLVDDYYYYDDAAHSLIGRRTQRRFRLGDKVRVKVVRVDIHRRQLDFRVVVKKPSRAKEADG